MSRRQDHQKNRLWKGLLVSFLTGAAVWTLLYLLTWGIPLWGLPQAGEIVSAQATFEGHTEEVKPADMELARNLPSVLHAWFGKTEERIPRASVTYTLADGSEAVVAADEKVIYLNGKYYRPKGSGGKIFYNIVQDFVDVRGQ